MKRKALPIGIDNFEKLITRDYYFVDKTLFIKDLLDNKADVNLFTRPRRFGKTLNMSMLQYFFEDMRDEFNGTKKDNSYLFEGLNIMDAGEQYTKHMGKYPVINLSLKCAKQPTFKRAFEELKKAIAYEYERHKFILEDEKLVNRKERYLRILNVEGNISDYSNSLQFLSQCLEKYYNKKVIILIDEYDVPLENSYFNKFYDEMIVFIRSLFEGALKTNPSLEFSVITGCLRISKESIFTGLNNIKTISILNARYDEYFGFTDDDVKKICNDYDMPSKYEVIKEWYNGYLFGKVNVYNPWSVMQYVDDLTADIEKMPYSYWANTSSNSIVKSLIDRADDETKSEIELLIEGKTIEKPVHEDITYDDVYDSMDNLWNFMFFTGYFKKVNERMEDEIKYIEFAIPNKEVKYIFKTKILKWFNDNIKHRDFSKMYDAIINKNPEVFEEELADVLLETISFNDAYENFYHGFTVGVLSNMKRYLIKSNRESGKGRSDIIIRSVSRRGAAVILELKAAKSFDELEKKADEALGQIEEKNYEAELRSDGYKNIIKYGIAFYGKDCLVKLSEDN